MFYSGINQSLSLWGYQPNILNQSKLAYILQATFSEAISGMKHILINISHKYFGRGHIH